MKNMNEIVRYAAYIAYKRACRIHFETELDALAENRKPRTIEARVVDQLYPGFVAAGGQYWANEQPRWWVRKYAQQIETLAAKILDEAIDEVRAAFEASL
jgi:hypothetical protein